MLARNLTDACEHAFAFGCQPQRIGAPVASVFETLDESSSILPFVDGRHQTTRKPLVQRGILVLAATPRVTCLRATRVRSISSPDCFICP